MAPHSTSNQTRRILVIAGGDDAPAELAALFPDGEFRVAHSVEEALEILDREPIEHVLAGRAELPALARGARAADAPRVFDDMVQPVAIVQRDGQLIWSNARLNQYPPAVAEALRQQCLAAIGEFSEELARGVRPGGRQQSFAVGQDHFFDLSISPLLDGSGAVERVVGVAWDISRAKRLQRTVNALDDAGREIVEIDTEAIAKWEIGDRLQLLEEKIVNVAHTLLHFDHFIVRVLNQKNNKLEAVIASGLPDEAIMADFRASPDGEGISGWVAATGKSYICPDTDNDPRYRPGLEQPGSTLTVPLFLHDRVIGVLNVESHAKGAFSEDDRQFAEILARYIAIALHILNLLVVERHTTTGHIAADVNSESAVALNQIVNDVSAIMVDYPDAKLQGRLRQIIADVDKVREAIHAVTDPNMITGLVPDSGERDPLLSGKRILIVDDEEIIRETIAEVLAKSGAITALADDGAAAVEMLEQRAFDLVLSDIKMPNRNGYEVFAAARRANPNCGVILMTGFGYDPNHAIVRASREGLSGVLFKPFKVDKLLEDVRASLQNPLGAK